MTRKTKGVLLLSLPLVLIVSILLAFVIINTLLQAAVPVGPLEGFIPHAYAQDMVTSPESDMIDIMRSTMNYGLGFLGTLSLIAILVCVPLGIYFLMTSDRDGNYSHLRCDPDFKNLSDEQLKYIDGVSWGAFFGAFIWPLSTGLYWWALGRIVPLFNIYVFFKLWFAGRRLSWKALQPMSFEDFRKRQNLAAWILVAFVGFPFLAIIIGTVVVAISQPM